MKIKRKIIYNPKILNLLHLKLKLKLNIEYVSQALWEADTFQHLTERERINYTPQIDNHKQNKVLFQSYNSCSSNL